MPHATVAQNAAPAASCSVMSAVAVFSSGSGNCWWPVVGIDRIAILQREVGDDRAPRASTPSETPNAIAFGRLPVLRLAGAERQKRDEAAVLLDDAVDVDALGLGARLGEAALFFATCALGLLELALLERVDALRLAVAHVLEEAHGDRRVDDRDRARSRAAAPAAT